MNLTLHFLCNTVLYSIELHSHHHCVSRSVAPDYLQPCGLQPARLLCPWCFPGKDTAMVCHFLLWGFSFSRDWTRDSCTAGRFFTDWATREAHPQLGIVGFGSASSFFLEPISPLFTSNTLDTYWPGGRIFQCHIFLPFHTFHGVLRARILQWFAIPISSGPRFVRTLHHDPSILGGAQHGS